MGDCNRKIKHTCGKKIKAVCVYYDGYIPEDSELHGSDCVTIEETTEDLYNITDEIKDEIDLTDLGSDCIDYEEEESGDIKVREALKKHEELICDIKDQLQIGDSTTIDISNWNIDTACLEDACGTGFNELEDLIQAMIYKICDCCSNTYSSNTEGIGLL